MSKLSSSDTAPAASTASTSTSAHRAGSCHGGSASHAYDLIKNVIGYVPYDTCMPYIACSSDSTEGFCSHVDTSCRDVNICRTCSSSRSFEREDDDVVDVGGSSGSGSVEEQDGSGTTGISTCSAISTFPNATIAEFGVYHINSTSNAMVEMIMAEIYVRGPVKAAVNATPLIDYAGGIIGEHDDDPSLRDMGHNHGVSIVGWGCIDDDDYRDDDDDDDDTDNGQYWIVRNSWGQ